MREILFRGKRIDNGEWVEGYYAKAKDYLDEKEMYVIFPLDLVLYPHSEFSKYEEVIPETVGQYTGLTDKNGKIIFEGDILCYTNVYANNHKSFGEVKSEEWNCGCCNDVYGFSILGAIDLAESHRCEIVGNIHDNPELLKGGD